jgi:hypothetical protein
MSTTASTSTSWPWYPSAATPSSVLGASWPAKPAQLAQPGDRGIGVGNAAKPPVRADKVNGHAGQDLDPASVPSTHNAPRPFTPAGSPQTARQR